MKWILCGFIFLMPVISIAQNLNSTQRTPVKTASHDTLLYKTPLPVNKKASPAIFYIQNDQPVSRASYKPVPLKSKN